MVLTRRSDLPSSGILLPFVIIPGARGHIITSVDCSRRTLIRAAGARNTPLHEATERSAAAAQSRLARPQCLYKPAAWIRACGCEQYGGRRQYRVNRSIGRLDAGNKGQNRSLGPPLNLRNSFLARLRPP